MSAHRLIAVVTIGLGIPAVFGTEAEASDPDARFASSITSQIGGKTVRLVLTGTAVRTKYLFTVYTIGSYVQEGTKVRDAERLARVQVPKQLHLIFERDVDGDTLTKSFREAIAMSHPAPAFNPELAKLEQLLRPHPVKKGDHIWLTYIPDVGLACQVTGQPSRIVGGVEFARAAWEVYLGPKNLGVAIKSGLSSRL